MAKWLVAVAAVVFMGTWALAAEDADKDKPVRARGVVKSVKADEGKTDAGTLVVTVKKGDKEEDLTFVVNAESSMKDGDKVLKLTDLKAGDKVRVDYKVVDGKNVVVKLRVENEGKEKKE